MKNLLKEKLIQGKQCYGAWISIEAPICTELMSSLGYDYLVFDTEHSPLDILTVQTLMQVVMNETTTPIVRVWWNDLIAIKRALDIGAHGVLVPWVNSREEAIHAVKATRYPPEGLRGCGPRRPLLFDPGYYETANHEIMVICQIETRKAVENIDEIVSVEGVDATYIGPADLAASLGHLGDMEHPEVQKAIDTILSATKKSGKKAGIHVAAGKSIEYRMRQGFDLITLGRDIDYLKNAVTGQMKKLGIG
jgi:2-keto-3-deoxy-L-rhamnonate aldolase RhmA